MLAIMGPGVRARLREAANLAGFAALLAIFCVASLHGRAQPLTGSVGSHCVAQCATHAEVASVAVPHSGLRRFHRRAFAEETSPPAPERMQLAELAVPPRRDVVTRVVVPVLLSARVPRSNRQRAP